MNFTWEQASSSNVFTLNKYLRFYVFKLLNLLLKVLLNMSLHFI